MTTTRTRRTKATTTTLPTEDATPVEETAEELRRQVANADDAMRGLDLRISDLREQIAGLEQTEEDILQEQEARTDSIRSLQTEIGQLSLELEDLKVDVAIKGDTATSASVQKRKDLQRTAKNDLRVAQTADTKLLREETERLTQLAEDKKLLEKQVVELETQRNTFATKQAAISADLGEALYREGGTRLDELARAKRNATLDARHFEEEEARARQALKLELQPWYGLRQKAIQEFHLDQKAPDGTSRIILGLIDLLNVLEQNGTDVPMLLDGKPFLQQLSPLSGDVLRTLVGMNALSDMDRRNYFEQRRTQLKSLLEKHNAGRW